MTPDGAFATQARHLGKSARTRARLMDAAVAVFARQGFEAASVNEIARAADVANGTFYVHFKDKDAIVAAVAVRIATDVAGRLDEAMAGVDDAVERVSLATRRFIDLAAAEPDWGWALIRAAQVLPGVGGQVGAHLRADLERGARQGAFQVEVDDFLVAAQAAIVMAALASRLRGAVGLDAGSRAAEIQLRALGVPSGRAHEVAFKPIEWPKDSSPRGAKAARAGW